MDVATLFIFILILCPVSQLCYYIGYIKGFKKSKDIDDKIIDGLSKKYNKDNNEK